MNCRSLILPLHRLPENELHFCHVEEAGRRRCRGSDSSSMQD